MPTYIVPVTWQASRSFSVVADSPDEAAAMVQDDSETFPAEDGEYIFNTFAVDHDSIICEEGGNPVHTLKLANIKSSKVDKSSDTLF